MFCNDCVFSLSLSCLKSQPQSYAASGADVAGTEEVEKLTSRQMVSVRHAPTILVLLLLTLFRISS